MDVWRADWWLPRGIEWHQLPTNFYDLVYPIYFALPLLVFRYSLGLASARFVLPSVWLSSLPVWALLRVKKRRFVADASPSAYQVHYETALPFAVSNFYGFCY